MKKYSREVLMLFLCGALIFGFYQMGVMDSGSYTREPIKDLIETLNKYRSDYLSIKNPAPITYQIFRWIPKPEGIPRYNKFKSPLNVNYRDLPYIDEVTAEKNISELTYPDLYKEKNYTSKTPLKKILMWNDAYSEPHFGFGFGQQPFLLAKCPVNTCFTSHDRKKFNYKDWDAVVWHFRARDKSLPKQRSNHTRYVFWMMESAVHLYGNLKPYNGKFNWTMLYRMDSDIYHPYGMLFKRRSPLPPGPYVDYSLNKTKMAAWFVSNCNTQSGRNILEENLQKHIQVDVYGGCGKFKCDRKQWINCLRMLEKDYKFYFSFENSLCRDYVTEKFFNILSYNVIPVVYGFGNYSLQAPPHSYIDALDYPNVTALANYLKYLYNNNTAYNEYFEWKRYYINIDQWHKVAWSWCKLCEMLHKDNKPKVYTDLYKWFVTDSHCKSKRTSVILNFVNGIR